jgi:arsenate reductase (thioredoxin)
MSRVEGLSPVARHHADKAIDALVEEFSGFHDRATIERVMEDSLRQLVREAEVDDFLSTLAYRFARERLSALARPQGLTDASQSDVLFIGLGDTGRGQMAAALVTLRSEGHIVAHSAGSGAATDIDAAVVEVMSELGVDLADAYPKPLSPEVLAAADIVITMGRSVGAIEIPDGTQHRDWRIGDPTGAPIDEVRRIRDEIDGRVQSLLDELSQDEPHPAQTT